MALDYVMDKTYKKHWDIYVVIGNYDAVAALLDIKTFGAFLFRCELDATGNLRKCKRKLTTIRFPKENNFSNY